MNNDFYTSYGYLDTLEFGKKLLVNRTIFLNEAKTKISSLVKKPGKEIESLQEKSQREEQAIYDKMRLLAKQWEKHAAATLLYAEVLEYQKKPVLSHTSNEWVQGDLLMTRSNAVYVMQYRREEDTEYDRGTGKNRTVAWKLSWDIWVRNAAARSDVQIAGQRNKRFTSFEAREKYLKGRIKAYDHLFQEIFPVVPAKYKRQFMCNGVLLPGYKVENEE
jgi:hypothetical protein